MGELRPQSMMLIFASLFALSACVVPQGTSDVQVKNLSPAGTVSISNNGPDIILRRKVTVEKHTGASWTVTEADVRLIAACNEAEAGATRVLHKGETLNVKGWNGFTCSGQCERSCRANVYVGPGEFRLVVVSDNGKQRFEGAPFSLGPEPKR